MKKTIILLMFVFLLIPFVVEAQKFDYYNTNDDDYYTMGASTTRRAQQFNATSNYTLSTVNLKLVRTGTPNYLNVSIYTADSSYYPSSRIASVRYPANAISTGTGGTWYNITLDNIKGNITQNKRYVIVIYSTTQDASNYISWRGDGTSPTYTLGTAIYSVNSGASWATDTGRDLMFEVYGSYIAPTPATDYFKIYAYNYYGNASISTFNVTFNSVEFNGTAGVATTTYANNASISRSFNVSSTNYLKREYEDINTATDKNTQLYPYIKLYAENKYSGSQLSIFSAELDGYKNFSTTNGSLSTDTALSVKNYNVTLTTTDYTTETIELNTSTIATNGTYKFNMTPVFRFYAENKYNNTQLNTFTAELDGYKNFSTTNGSLKTDTSLDVKNYNVTIRANKYFENLTEINSLNIATNGTYKFNMTPYTAIRVKTLATNAFLENFSINWNSSTGVDYTNTTTNGYVYVPLYNDKYNVTAFNILDNGGYARQTQEISATPYLKSYNFSVYTINSINFNFYDEATLNLLPENTSIDLSIYGALLINYSNIHLTNYTYYIDLLTPDVYTIEYNATGYNKNFYYQIITNESYNDISLYLSSTGLTTSDLRLRVKNAYTYQDYPNIIVKMQRLFPSLGSWVTIQMDKSGEYGYTYFSIEELTTEYRFIFEDTSGNVLKTSEPLKFGCSSGLCEITAFVTPYGAVAAVIPELKYNSTLSNSSENGSVNWIASDNNNHLVNITVYKPNINNYVKLCSYQVTAASGSAICNLTGKYGEVMIQIYVDGDKYAQFFDRISIPKLAQNLDKQDQVFFAIGIFITMVALGLYSPIATIVLGVMALFVISVLGLLTAIATSTIILAAIIGVLIGIKVKK